MINPSVTFAEPGVAEPPPPPTNRVSVRPTNPDGCAHCNSFDVVGKWIERWCFDGVLEPSDARPVCRRCLRRVAEQQDSERLSCPSPIPQLTCEICVAILHQGAIAGSAATSCLPWRGASTDRFSWRQKLCDFCSEKMRRAKRRGFWISQLENRSVPATK